MRATTSIKRLIFAFIVLLISACAHHDEPLHRSQLLTLGTLVNISIWHEDGALADEAIHRVEHRLDDIHKHWHAWQPSELTRLNQQLAAGETVSLNSEAKDLLSKAKELAIRSEHLFNPAIGRLIGLWGFHSDERADGPPPSPTELNKLLAARPRMSDLDIGTDTIRSTNPLVQIDLGAFAKGYAVDLAIAELRASGIENAIVNAGGDLRAIGSHGQRPWRIGIRHPLKPGIIASLETRGDESVFTSGNYERYFTYNGIRYHHIIDPRSAYPATGTLSVTVIHSDAATADAAATALFVAGPKQWQHIARRMGIHQVMLIDDKMNVYMSTAMAKRIVFEIDPAPTITLSDI